MKISPKFKFKVGDIVKYHPIIGGGDDGKVYRIVSTRILWPNNPVYHLDHKRGCVAEASLTKIRKNVRNS